MNRTTKDLDDSRRYEIRIQGHLDGRWAVRFDGLPMRHEVDGTTVLDGVIADQAALHGLLQRIRDLGLALVSVTRIEPRDRPSGDAPSPTPSA